MRKCELPRVQHLARQIFGKPRAVDFVAENRVTEMMQMHADLVRAAAVQFAFDQTRALVLPNDPIFRPRGAAAR